MPVGAVPRWVIPGDGAPAVAEALVAEATELVQQEQVPLVQQTPAVELAAVVQVVDLA